jgi:hypothetical protein
MPEYENAPGDLDPSSMEARVTAILHAAAVLK